MILAIVLVTILIVAIAIVTVSGNQIKQRMKDKKLFRYTKQLMIAVFVIWLLFILIPLSRMITGKEILSGIDDAYVMGGALFTGLAFAATYASLLIQNRALRVQLAMSTLSSTVNLILDSERFRESRKYVMSMTFFNHVKILEKIKKDDPIFIEDWKKIDNGEKGENSTDEYINSYKAYEKLIYFCSRMEYLGIVLKNKGIDYTILDYYGNTIIESYKRLEPYIKNSRLRFGETYYFHYTYLYYWATQREPKFKQECKELLEMMSKNKLKFED